MTTPLDDITEPLTDPDRWVERYGGHLYGFAMRRVSSPGMAEDLLQETFLAALKARHRFEGRSSERTWLFGILKNKIIDHFRRASRENQLPAAFTEERMGEGQFDNQYKWSPGPARWRSDPQLAYEQEAFLAVFYGCLASLKRRTAQAFTMREMEGAPTEEICKVLGVSPSNCWVMLHRARSALRLCLEKKWFSTTKKADDR